GHGHAHGHGHGHAKMHRIPPNLLDQFEKQLPLHPDGFHTLQYQRSASGEQRSESPSRIRHLVNSVQRLFAKSHSLEAPSKREFNGCRDRDRERGQRSGVEDGAGHHHPGTHQSRSTRRSKSRERSKSGDSRHDSRHSSRHRSKTAGWWSSDDNLDSDSSFLVAGGRGVGRGYPPSHETLDAAIQELTLKKVKGPAPGECLACSTMARVGDSGHSLKRSTWSAMTVNQAREAYPVSRGGGGGYDKALVPLEGKLKERNLHYLQASLGGVCEECSGGEESEERFWSELDEVMESIPTSERVVIGADFNGHVGERNRGDEEVMGKFGVKERNLEGQMVVDFAKRMDMAVVNTYFQKREEHRVTYKSGGRRTQVVLPDDWETTAEVIRETGRKVLGVSSGRRKEDKETWWWNEEVQDSIQRTRLAKKKWDMDRTEENRQEYKELQRRVKREVSKAKQKAYDELYTRLDTIEGEKDLYRLARQRDQDGKDVQQYRDGQRELHCLFVDLEKAYDRMPREELWYCMRKSGVAEKYVRVVQDMYERSRTVVRCAVVQTEEFKVEVGLHQGSALSPFLFAMVMDQLSEEVRQESPWTMMFADDIVICSESREQVEENLERWRFALEGRGMKVSRSKTEYMCVNEREGSGTVRLQGEEVKKVQEFKYLGTTVQSNGECGKEVPSDEWGGVGVSESGGEIPCRRMRSGSYIKAMGDDDSADSDTSPKTSPKRSLIAQRDAFRRSISMDQRSSTAKWKGSKARSIGAGFKLFYYGVDSKRNGVGVVLEEEFVRNVLEVKRVSDRVMSLKLEIEGVMLNVVSGYAPQVGCELEEKERFWSELDEVMESIPTGDMLVRGTQKREEHRVTYKSGGRRTQVDYMLCRRGNLKEISDCKVVVGESVARQHRMVVCRMTLMVCKKKRLKIEIEKKTKWWKLKKEECCEEFRQKLRQALGGQAVLPDDWETTAEVIRETGKKVLGVSSGRRKEDKETWWWNEEVQDSIQRRRLAKKKWDMDRTEENRQEYKELQHRVKREVSKAKQKAYDELYTRLDTREVEKDLYRLARQRDQDGKDVQQVRVIKDRDGRVLTSEESVQRRWKEYFEELMNEENEREKRVEGVNSVEQKYRDGQRELHCLFVDLEKAYDRVPREELWYCMRKSGVAEKYVRVVQDMYERSRTVVRCAVGQTEEFKVEVGLHQGSALSLFLFAIVMDQLSEEDRQESPWTIMFADDIVICSESREQVEENLGRWRFALERRGMKVSRSKTEYMCVNEREGSGTVRLQGEEVKKVQEFKYLGSTVQSNGECGKEVKKRVQAGWNGWRKVSGVLCDRKISARIKGKVYRTVVRPAMLYGLETVSLRKRQESELEVAELKMLRFSLGVTRLDRIRNEYIRGTAHVGRLGDKVRETRLRWFGHVQRRESEYVGRRMLDMELPGRRQRGRPKRRYSCKQCTDSYSNSRTTPKGHAHARSYTRSLTSSQLGDTLNRQFESVCESVFGEIESQAVEALDLPGCFRTRSHSYVRAIQAGCSQDDDCLSVFSMSGPQGSIKGGAVFPYRKGPPPLPPRMSKPMISVTAQSSTESTQDAYFQSRPKQHSNSVDLSESSRGGYYPSGGAMRIKQSSNSTEGISMDGRALRDSGYIGGTGVMRPKHSASAENLLDGPRGLRERAGGSLGKSASLPQTSIMLSKSVKSMEEQKQEGKGRKWRPSIAVQVDSSETLSDSDTEGKALREVHSIGVQVEDDKRRARFKRSNSVTASVQADLEMEGFGVLSVPMQDKGLQFGCSFQLHSSEPESEYRSTVHTQGQWAYRDHYHGAYNTEPCALELRALPHTHTERAVASWHEGPRSLPDSGRASPCHRDGEFFLRLLQTEVERMEGWCQSVEREAEENELPEDVLELIRAAVGSAQMLMSQKVQQFFRMCQQNVDPTAYPQPTTQDLASFWDLLQLAIEDVRVKFQDLQRIKDSGWRLPPEKKEETKLPPPLPKKPAGGVTGSLRAESMAETGVGSTGGTLMVTRGRSMPVPLPLREKSLELGDRQRLEARRRLLQAGPKRAASFRQNSATESGDSIEIYIPEAQTRL
ncbi:hypothetical protein QTP70_027665, partial [Hemibagrus guttatus]